MIQFTVHLPDNDYQALRTTAKGRGESIDNLIARCLALPRRPSSDSRWRLSLTYPSSQVLTTSVLFRHHIKGSLAFISTIPT